jgi:hypothetical protein
MADIACPATAELSPSVASRQCPRLQSQVSGEHVQADWSRHGGRHCVIVNIAPGLTVKPFDWPYPRPEATFNVRHGCQELAADRKVGGSCLASSAWRFEQGGDLSDGFGAWADVSHRGARVAVPGLGHDQLQGDASGRRGRGAMRVSRRADSTGERGCAPTICDWPGRRCAKIALPRLCVPPIIES